MISATVSIILALLLNLKTPFLAPIVYLSSYWRKDLFLTSFLFYSLFLGYEFTIGQIFFEVPAFTLLFATLLLLEEGLVIKKKGMTQYLLVIFTLIGSLFIEALFTILIATLCYYICQDRPKRGVIVLIFPGFAISLFIFFGEQIVYLGSTATQAILITSITALVFLVWLRKI